MAHPEHHPSLDPVVDFRHYEVSVRERLGRAETTLVHSMNLFAGGYELVNDALAEAGRPDLAIAVPATMMPIGHPSEILEKCNNFTPSFEFHTRRRETGEKDWQSKPVTEAVPATEEEILALQALPLIGSFEEFHELEQQGAFAALSVYNHSKLPAFLRMLILAPGFTARFVLDFSASESTRRYARFEPELFVAYQLMSRLVDTSDISVIREDSNEVDDWYLCR